MPEHKRDEHIEVVFKSKPVYNDTGDAFELSIQVRIQDPNGNISRKTFVYEKDLTYIERNTIASLVANALSKFEPEAK